MNNFLKRNLKFKDGMFFFDVTDEKTKKVIEFYDETPFPNYKDYDNKQTILEKGNKNLLANQFKNFIGYKKNVLEVGCGTGQLSNYFAIGTNNNIVGLDPTKASLDLAKNFANKNKITNIQFVNADIFDDVLNDEFFHFIWSIEGIWDRADRSSHGAVRPSAAIPPRCEQISHRACSIWSPRRTTSRR